MDPVTIVLLTIQSINFVWLILTVALPALNTPAYNGDIEIVEGIIRSILTPGTVVPPAVSS